MSTTADNPFASADAWTVSTSLPEGSHVVTIQSVMGSSSANGRPKLELTLINPQGSARDFIPYSGDFLRRIVAPFDAAGIARPQPGEFNPADNYRLSETCIARLVGQTVGIVIKPEADQDGKMWNRVQGYLPASRIDGGADTRGLPAANGTPEQPPPSGQQAKSDIPF
jgi:hypothetical protein